MKIALIGAGSYVFAPGVLQDALIDHRIDDSDFAMVDLDFRAAERMANLGRVMAADAGVQARLSAMTDWRDALPGADFVILSAAIQGERRWRMDAEIIGRYDMPDQMEENGTLAGLSYSLRTITLALALARDMERLCPQAILLDVANPMPRVLTAIKNHTAIRALGFCNAAWGGPNGYRKIGQWAGRDPGDLEIVTAGLNHFAWLLVVKDRRTGEDLYPVVEKAVREGRGKEYDILRMFLREYGGIGVSGAPHMLEWVPCDPALRRTVSPPFHGSAQEREERFRLIDRVIAGAANWREVVGPHRSWERPLDAAAALATRATARFDMINLPNDGYIPQLPNGRIVETPAIAAGGGIRGCKVPALPDGVAAICRAISDTHEVVADAAATGDRAKARQAVEMDPSIPDKPRALRALDELLAAHADILPQFAASGGQLAR